MSRPQYKLPPQIYYNQYQSNKYDKLNRIQQIQSQLTERCIQLLNIQNQHSLLILDLGCGSAISGNIIQNYGHTWIGVDISQNMLKIANKDKYNDTYLIDLGQGFRFRSGVFDAAISVSAIQWLCVASKKDYNVFKRICIFFQSLYNSLKMGGRAVLQFYPDGNKQIEMITTGAMKAGFSGGLIVDFPNSTKAKKYFLVIEAGGNRKLQVIPVKGLQEQVQVQQVVKVKRLSGRKIGKKHKLTKRQRIIKLKQRRKKKGKRTHPLTKYCGRSRKHFAI